MASRGKRKIKVRVIRVRTKMLVRAGDGTYHEGDCTFLDSRAGNTYVDGDTYMAELGPREEEILEVTINAPIVELLDTAAQNGWETRSRKVEPEVKEDA